MKLRQDQSLDLYRCFQVVLWVSLGKKDADLQSLGYLLHRSDGVNSGSKWFNWWFRFMIWVSRERLVIQCIFNRSNHTKSLIAHQRKVSKTPFSLNRRWRKLVSPDLGFEMGDLDSLSLGFNFWGSIWLYVWYVDWNGWFLRLRVDRKKQSLRYFQGSDLVFGEISFWQSRNWILLAEDERMEKRRSQPLGFDRCFYVVLLGSLDRNDTDLQSFWYLLHGFGGFKTGFIWFWWIRILLWVSRDGIVFQWSFNRSNHTIFLIDDPLIAWSNLLIFLCNHQFKESLVPILVSRSQGILEWDVMVIGPLIQGCDVRVALCEILWIWYRETGQGYLSLLFSAYFISSGFRGLSLGFCEERFMECGFLVVCVNMLLLHQHNEAVLISALGMVGTNGSQFLSW